jgi:hypothetical protein
MTVWCVLVLGLVAVVVAIGFAMFYMPAHGTPVEQRTTTQRLTNNPVTQVTKAFSLMNVPPF